MNTFRRRRCQTLRALVVAAWCVRAGGLVMAGTEVTPAPPAWQQEIDAAKLLDGALTLAPSKDAVDQETRHRQVQELYRQLARKYPREAAVQRATGDYFARDGQPPVSLPYWEQAAQLDPHDAGTAERLGGAYLRQGRTRDAYGQYQRAVDEQPAVASHHSDLANVLYMFRHDLMSPPIQGLPDEQAALVQALAHFRRAAELAPEDAQLAQAYAETFYVFAKPDWAQALIAWEAVRVLSGDKSDFSNSHLARISLRLGKPDAAVEYLARIHDPQFDGLKAKLLQQADRQRNPAEHQ